MKTKIAFVVMSAIHSPESVAQLARALAPHTVVVHHDFSQTPDFHVDEPNVRFVPSPKRTGWAIWGFSKGSSTPSATHTRTSSSTTCRS